MVKRVGFLLAIVTVCLAIWSTLGNQSAEPQDTGGPDLTESTSPTGMDTASQPVPTPEPLISEGESIVYEEQSSESCDELSRLTETTGLRVSFAEDVEVNEAACNRALRFSTGAMMPALPGLAGFEVRDIIDTSPAHRLANEPDDPSWARGMEGQVLNTIASLIDFPVNSVHAVCRAATCGLVFSYRSSYHSATNYNFYAQRLADELGFTGFHGGVQMPRDGNWHMAIYLGDWDTPRPDVENPARTLPSSFEEALERFQTEGDNE